MNNRSSHNGNFFNILNRSNDEDFFLTLDQSIKNSEFGNVEKSIKNLLNNFPMALITKHIVKTFKEQKLIKIIKKVSNERLRSFCNQENKMDGYLLKWIIFYRNPKFVLKIFNIVKNRDIKLFKDIFICNDRYINNPLIRVLNQYKHNYNFSKEDSKKYLIKLLKCLDEETVWKICNTGNDFSNIMLYILRHSLSEYDDFAFEIINNLPKSSQMILCKKHIIGYSNLLLLSAEKGPMSTIKILFNLKKIKHEVTELLTMYDYFNNTFLELMIESGEPEKISFILDELEEMDIDIFSDFCFMPLCEDKKNNPENILIYLLENINKNDKFFCRLLDKINKTSEHCHEFHQISLKQLKKIEKKNRVFVIKSMDCTFKYRILEEKHGKLNKSLYELSKEKNSITKIKNEFFSRDKNILIASIYAEKIIKLKKKVLDQNEDKNFKKKCFQQSINFSEKYNLKENLENVEKSFKESNEKYTRLLLEYLKFEKKIKNLINPFDNSIHQYEKKYKEKIKLVSLFLFLFYFQEKYKEASKEYTAFQKKENQLFIECYPLPNKNNKKKFSNKELKYSHSAKSIRQFSRLNNALKNLEMRYLEYVNAQETYNFYKEGITKKLNNKKFFRNNKNFNELQINFNRFYGENRIKQENKIDTLDQTQMLLCLLRMCYGEISVNNYVEFFKKKTQITDNIQIIEKEMTELENKKHEIDIQEHRCILEIYTLFSGSDQNRIEEHTDQAANQKRIIH